MLRTLPFLKLHPESVGLRFLLFRTILNPMLMCDHTKNSLNCSMFSSPFTSPPLSASATIYCSSWLWCVHCLIFFSVSSIAVITPCVANIKLRQSFQVHSQTLISKVNFPGCDLEGISSSMMVFVYATGLLSSMQLVSKYIMSSDRGW